MSGTPSFISADQRKAVFDAWLKPLNPVRSSRTTIVAKIAPWRNEFMGAISQGYTWAQLAQEICPKPEINVKISGEHLRKSVRRAFAAANEPVPSGISGTRRRKRAKKPTANSGGTP